MLLEEEREQQIVESYRRGYEKHPQEDWIGEVGLALFAAWVESEQHGKEPL